MVQNTPAAEGEPGTERYRGRFAPSPSGNLHFGSLVTALASYLIAKKQQGTWLLRIDDIDQPRVKPGATDSILKTLEAHGLYWDEPVYYQSQHLDYYRETLTRWQQQGYCYYCDCTRQAIKARGTLYDGFCRARKLSQPGCAVRIKNPGQSLALNDARLGQIQVPDEVINEDFVLQRRDGIFGYHLVAVLDDIQQNVTQVVRGADLLLPSACQLVLYNLLHHPTPSFLHIPLAVSSPGKKLSKQNHSPELDETQVQQNLCSALDFLGADIPPELLRTDKDRLLNWAVQHWNPDNLPSTLEKKVTGRWC
ncbi:tRNA glutamyl-Q(34) synthetase GluQRS [Planctobacterium marinum]|uniref:tRNA glutamyl-Q(34) synthetase GluQRS n=1 Tax=Planctobacterium marinum TaxID=1631968 RepID=UPI001E50A778|nr:tRNA glutamyl-Q(34) synthetase GluQRS [Planctobacterium marinum]MCC2606645.1 tRNA glutamyl-Q(34) synthetase GluQRS [Planctobacterium marinum]